MLCIFGLGDEEIMGRCWFLIIRLGFELGGFEDGISYGYVNDED